MKGLILEQPLKLEELINLSHFQSLCDNLYDAFKVPSALISIDGKILTQTGWQKICSEFHRKDPELEKDCIKSDTEIRAQIKAGAPYAIYTCPRGLVDVCSPIKIENTIVGHLFTGQFFLKIPSSDLETTFKEQAKKFNFDEKLYMQAFHEVPIFTHDHILKILSFFVKMAEQLATEGQLRLKEKKQHQLHLENEKNYFEEKENLNLALSSANMGTFEWDIKTNVRYWDEKTHQLLGTDINSFDGTAEAFYSVIHPDDRDHVKKSLLNAVEKTSKYETRYRAVMKNGEIRYIIARGTVYADENKNPSKMLGICWDVTERTLLNLEKEQIKNQLFHSTRLASIGTFTASIAHEISNPLAIIFGYLDELLKTQKDDKNILICQKLQNATNRISNLLLKLKKLSRSDENVKKPVDLRQSLEETLSLLTPLYKHKGVTITHFDTATNPFCLGSSTCIQQVFLNLIANAFDALSDTPSPHIHFIFSSDENFVILKIKDNGPGIEEKIIEKLFTPFFTTKSPEKGTGLGLSICKKIVEEHKGEITVSSILGEGTTFQLKIPLYNP